MLFLKTVVFIACLSQIDANFVRINNTGTEDLVLILENKGHPPSNGTLLPAGLFTELIVLNEWEGSFYTYPIRCFGAPTPCDYPVTKVSVAFSKWMFGSFYDFLLVDLNRGFNLPASIKSLTRSDCDLSCTADLLPLCPEEDQILDENNTLITCRTSTRNFRQFKEKCPEARVDGSDLDLRVCASMNYEITFG